MNRQEISINNSAYNITQEAVRIDGEFRRQYRFDNITDGVTYIGESILFPELLDVEITTLADSAYYYFGITYRMYRLSNGYIILHNFRSDGPRDTDTILETIPDNTLVFDRNMGNIRLNLELTTWSDNSVQQILPPIQATENIVASNATSSYIFLNSIDDTSDTVTTPPPQPEPAVQTPEPAKPDMEKLKEVDPKYAKYIEILSGAGSDYVYAQDKSIKSSIRHCDSKIYEYNMLLKDTKMRRENYLSIQKKLALHKRRMKLAVSKMHEPTMDISFLDFIKTVHVTKYSGILQISTNLITIPYQVKSRFATETVLIPIGEFRINININTLNVTFNNITRLINHEYQHPHITIHNTCWGDFRYEEVLNSCDMAEILCSFISYLRTYNAQSPYKPLLEGWGHLLPDEDKICTHTLKFIKHKQGRHESLVNDEPRHPRFKLPMSMVPYMAQKFPDMPVSFLHYFTDTSKAIVDELYDNIELRNKTNRLFNSGIFPQSCIDEAVRNIRTRMYSTTPIRLTITSTTTTAI